MNTATDSNSWRDKYFDSLSRLEHEQRRYQAMEAALKRIAGRLCTGSLGQSRPLDEQIKRLQAALRREATSEEFDEITPALTEAIRTLDQSASAVDPPAPEPKIQIVTPAQDVVADERTRAVLATLLAELRRDSELASEVDALDATLSSALTREQMPEFLSSIAELVARRIKRIESARQEIESLLNHMVGKLDEIGEFVTAQKQSQSESQASSETLSIQLASDMKAMGESVETASDLDQIRRQVRNRLDSIDQHLQQFREREAALANTMQARNEQMRLRIAELEAEARRLHHQLQDEQRQSTLDALTKIPNRLAYEKRIAEELQRWQRFKQPTCLAVWDVDHFKRINDTYGHRAGDRVLRVVAGALASRIRSTDFVARYGGEEFVMILPGTKPEDALRVVDQLRTAVGEIGFHFRGAPVSITISVGISSFLANDSANAAFDRADKALYQAKENGRNRCVSV